jgi:Flp pilus assembly protein TadD
LRFTVARLANNAGVACKRAGRLGGSAVAYRVALAMRPREPRLVAALLHNRAGLLHARERYADAEPIARSGLALREALVGRDHPDYGADLGALAAIVDKLGRTDEAEAMYLEALALLPDDIITRRNLAKLQAGKRELATLDGGFPVEGGEFRKELAT